MLACFLMIDLPLIFFLLLFGFLSEMNLTLFMKLKRKELFIFSDFPDNFISCFKSQTKFTDLVNEGYSWRSHHGVNGVP